MAHIMLKDELCETVRQSRTTAERFPVCWRIESLFSNILCKC